jgi:molecular chaperone DnaK
MRDLGDRVPQNDRARAEQSIRSIRQQIKDNSPDLAKLRDLTSDLLQIVHAISSASHSQATGSDGRAAGADSSSPGGAADVIDAEFKETK